MPVLPMVLVNGADGIGTGYSTSIPNYNPKDIIDNLIRMMDGQDPIPMKPWFRGFKGEILPHSTGRYTVNGIAQVTDDQDVKVTELPVRLWTETFTDHLNTLREPKDKKPEFTITVINILTYVFMGTELTRYCRTTETTRLIARLSSPLT